MKILAAHRALACCHAEKPLPASNFLNIGRPRMRPRFSAPKTARNETSMLKGDDVTLLVTAEKDGKLRLRCLAWG